MDINPCFLLAYHKSVFKELAHHNDEKRTCAYLERVYALRILTKLAICAATNTEGAIARDVTLELRDGVGKLNIENVVVAEDFHEIATRYRECRKLR